MKTCCVCRRPDVRWPLSIICHWCLQGEMERAVDVAIMANPLEPLRIHNPPLDRDGDPIPCKCGGVTFHIRGCQQITITQPSDIVPHTMTIVTARPKAILSPSGKIVLGAVSAP